MHVQENRRTGVHKYMETSIYNVQENRRTGIHKHIETGVYTSTGEQEYTSI